MIILSLHTPGSGYSKDIIYIRSAPNDEEWEGCWYRNHVGNILIGYGLKRQYLDSKLEKERKDWAEKKVKGDPKNFYHFFFNGWTTIHREGIIILNNDQFFDLQAKEKYGNKLNLGKTLSEILVEDSINSKR